MVPEKTIRKIKELLDQGGKRRDVAAAVGTSRKVVDSVATGRRPDYEALRREREEATRPLPHNGPLRRCPACGGLVYMPCQVCLIRKLLYQQSACQRQARRRANGDDEPLTLQLREHHRRRYEQLRAMVLAREMV